MPIYFTPPKSPREGPSIRKSSKMQDFWNRLVTSIGPTEPDPTSLIQPTPISGILAPLTRGRMAEIKRIVGPLLIDLETLYHSQFGRDFGEKQGSRIVNATISALGKVTKGVPLRDLKQIKSVNLNWVDPPPNATGYVRANRPDEIYFTPVGYQEDVIKQLMKQQRKRVFPKFRGGRPRTATEAAKRVLARPIRNPQGYLSAIREESGPWPGATVTHELGHTLSPRALLGGKKGETLADFYSLLTAGLDPGIDKSLLAVQDTYAAFDQLRSGGLDTFLRTISQRMGQP